MPKYSQYLNRFCYWNFKFTTLKKHSQQKRKKVYFYNLQVNNSIYAHLFSLQICPFNSYQVQILCQKKILTIITHFRNTLLLFGCAILCVFDLIKWKKTNDNMTSMPQRERILLNKFIRLELIAIYFCVCRTLIINIIIKIRKAKKKE